MTKLRGRYGNANSKDAEPDATELCTDVLSRSGFMQQYTIPQFRKNIFQIMRAVRETGEPVELVYGEHRLMVERLNKTEVKKTKMAETNKRKTIKRA